MSVQVLVIGTMLLIAGAGFAFDGLSRVPGVPSGLGRRGGICGWRGCRDLVDR